MCSFYKAATVVLIRENLPSTLLRDSEVDIKVRKRKTIGSVVSKMSK